MRRQSSGRSAFAYISDVRASERQPAGCTFSPPASFASMLPRCALKRRMRERSCTYNIHVLYARLSLHRQHSELGSDQLRSDRLTSGDPNLLAPSTGLASLSGTPPVTHPDPCCTPNSASGFVCVNDVPHRSHITYPYIQYECTVCAVLFSISRLVRRERQTAAAKPLGLCAARRGPAGASSRRSDVMCAPQRHAAGRRTHTSPPAARRDATRRTTSNARAPELEFSTPPTAGLVHEMCGAALIVNCTVVYSTLYICTHIRRLYLLMYEYVCRNGHRITCFKQAKAVRITVLCCGETLYSTASGWGTCTSSDSGQCIPPPAAAANKKHKHNPLKI